MIPPSPFALFVVQFDLTVLLIRAGFQPTPPQPGTQLISSYVYRQLLSEGRKAKKQTSLNRVQLSTCHQEKLSNSSWLIHPHLIILSALAQLILADCD